MPDFNMQQNFPIASVIDASVRNKALNLQAQQQNHDNLIQGINAIGAVGQSLYQRKLQMAQALSGAKMYAASPEGQQLLGTNPVAAAGGNTVTPNTTAAYDPSTGTVKPNSTGVNLGDIQTAMLGEKPFDVQNQLFQQRKQSEANAIAQGDLALKQKIEPQRLANEAALNKLLLGFKGQEAATQATHVENEDIGTLLSKREELAKDLPTGWWNSINNDKAESAKQQIAMIDSILAKKGYTGPATAKSPDGSYQLPGGGSYTVNVSGH